MVAIQKTSKTFQTTRRRDLRVERVEQAFQACGKARRKAGFEPLR
jgi:hypothetical protein